ncbi:MAG: preprotein translocase subunit SecA [Chloroflexota bacterium]|nr:preprotein translocase subunit SecA [Chloroflexota bacterium]
MFKKLLGTIFGDPNERELERLEPVVEEINALEPEMQQLSDEELRQFTRDFRDRLQRATAGYKEEIQECEEELLSEQDEEQRRFLERDIERLKRELDEVEAEILAEMLPQAFALVREASVRTIGLRHFDEQLMGGIVLHENRIAEMKTGEGKTLVATLPLYLSALTGRGAHLVTPNDYLSKRGAQWMGPIYHFLGIQVGVIQSMGEDPEMSSFLFDPDFISADDRYQHLRPCSRQEAYQADITYGTNNEFGFDFLRDNMVTDLDQCVQRELHYAIVDEIDNILIDEARTPLIISGPAEESTSRYRQFAQLVRRLREDVHYEVDEKERSVSLTEEGIEKVERALGIENLYAPEHFELTPYLENAIKAKALFKEDRDYIVRGGQVIIVDPFTGRLMHGRRYSEGLHQAIEAKEGVPVQRESLTLATVTFQNYFRMYRRLAGMTGTAATEAEEFAQIYDLDVVVIPTHEPMIRVDHSDKVYKTEEAKFRAVMEEIKECHARQQPVLVGTLAIETSEALSRRLKRLGIPHEVLNAKYHEREAQIIAQAGRPGAVTIATNMAGRGVDILLGGNPEGLARETLREEGYDLQRLDPGVWEETYQKAKEQCEADREIVLEAGGLHVLGTERYEARRIDNQLRGRSGRQGDPGTSRFYVSLEDDLMRRFGGPAVSRMMDQLGVDENMPIEHGMISKAIANAQTRVEGRNFDIRKHLLEYDDVLNQQRQVIYDQRRLILSEADTKSIVMDILADELEAVVLEHTASYDGQRDLEGLHATIDRMIHLPWDHSPEGWADASDQEITEEAIAFAEATYKAHEEEMGADRMRQLERLVMLRIIDNRWVRHLTALDELRQGIGLRAFGQQNPLVEYKREAFSAFEALMDEIRRDIANVILNTRIEVRPARLQQRRYTGSGESGAQEKKSQPIRRTKIGRNDPCPCGSGKKYKNCCMRKGLSPEEIIAQRERQSR